MPESVMPLHVGFVMMGSGDWTCGSLYLKNLFSAVKSVYADSIKISIVAFSCDSAVEAYCREAGADDFLIYAPSYKRFLARLSYRFRRRLLGYDRLLECFLLSHGVQAVFGPALSYDFRSIAQLSLLYDFQHIRLPEMFDLPERQKRTEQFMRTVKVADNFIVWSNAVKKDFDSFAPGQAHRVRVLPPVTLLPDSIYNYDLRLLLKLYGLPDKFIYLPNQFWKHKNHLMVFEAVKTLKDRGIEVLLVCTGNPSDYRHPTYFAELLEKISLWQIRDQVIFLGLVPWEHVLLLMRQCICVFNPSLFEGWASTVEEARSVGKGLLLSDIPAHREHNPREAIYFDPKDVQELTEKLAYVWDKALPGPDIELEQDARQINKERVCQYARSFVAIAQEVIEEAKVRNRGRKKIPKG